MERELAGSRPRVLGAQVGAPGHERLEQRRVVEGRPDLRAQELYAFEREWARNEADVLRRRTTAWLGGGQLDSEHGSELDAADPAARS